MRNKILMSLAAIGILAGCYAVYVFSRQEPALPPVFNPPENPFSGGIYAEGIVESAQGSGKNVNLYPEVAGTVKQVLVTEGQVVSKGTPLLVIDDSVQRAIVDQQRSQAHAAETLLQELKAQPRKENLEVAIAQVQAAEASLKNAQDELDKQSAAYQANPKSVSKDALDTANNAVAQAKSNLTVAQKQYELIKAGAWGYDITNQEHQYNALREAYLSSSALLAKYTLRAAHDGVILSINAAAGDYVSPQGNYDSYTQGPDPALVLGAPQTALHVRCYVDEILVPRIPPTAALKAQMAIRGASIRIPLEYVRTQPYVSPKIELSDQRQERVDVRVLPIIFRFDKPQEVNLYPGELVDVYIGK
jgi:HlyD family secretion protein